MRRFVLGAHKEARGRALQAVREAQDGLEVVIKPPTRTSAENALLHALITQIARSKSNGRALSATLRHGSAYSWRAGAG